MTAAAASAGTRELPPPPQQNGGITPAAVAALAEPTTPVEEIIAVLMAAEAQYERAKRLRDEVKAAVVEHIEATGKPLVAGTVEYRAQHARETKNPPEEKRATLHDLFDACKGDVDAVADCLCSDPYKPGTVKTILSTDVFKKRFVTVERVRLVDGKPRKQLVATDTRFLPGRE